MKRNQRTARNIILFFIVCASSSYAALGAILPTFCAYIALVFTFVHLVTMILGNTIMTMDTKPIPFLSGGTIHLVLSALTLCVVALRLRKIRSAR